jgi:hypothetical protein
MTALKSFDANGIQYAWDATSLSSASKCMRFYYYKHMEGWQPTFKSVHLIFGGHYARALELYAQAIAAGTERETAIRDVVKYLLENTWDYDRDENGVEQSAGAPQDWFHAAKTRETLVRSVVWYLEEFEDDPAKTVILANGEAAVEYSFSLPIDDDILYCGHIDKLVSYDDDKFVMDQKTSGATVTPRFFDQFSPDFQMSGYSFAGKIIFDMPISGVIIDAAQIAVGFTRFSRGFVHRSAPVLEDWLTNTLNVIGNTRRLALENKFPMNPASCGNYGGCEFRKICQRAPEHRDRALAADFERKPRWDPLEQR